MDKTTKQALKKATNKSDANPSHSFGYLNEFVQNRVDNIMVADVLRMMDIDPLQIIGHTIVRDLIITDEQISSWKSVRISEFPSSSKFIAFINREVECPPDAR